MFDAEVIIIGGGAAGLSCARHLQAAGVNWLLLEKSDRLGGRLRSEVQDGFTLDHGFHTLQPKYPEAKGLIDYKKLHCKPFAQGARIFHDGRWHTLADPRKHPLELFATLFNSISTQGDLLKLAWWAFRTQKINIDDLWQGTEKSALEVLKEKGFSQLFIESFFRPFFGGVTLDPTLASSARQMEFAFHMFAKARPVLPQGGIASIVPFLAQGLPEERIRLNVEVESRDGQELRLKDGSILRGYQLVIATENPVAKHLIGTPNHSTAIPFVNGLSTTVHYFEAPTDLPLKGPWLLLNGEPGGPILHGCFPSQVQPSYAPPGKNLFSASSVGPDKNNLEEVRTQMADWFGEPARNWTHLRSFHLPHALPRRESLRPAFLSERLSEHLFVCGDHRAYPSLNAALASGRRTAEAIIPETVF